MDIFKRITEAHAGQWEDVSYEQLVAELELDEEYVPYAPPTKQRKQLPVRRFRRSAEYKRTYLEKIRNNSTFKNKLHFFMEAKRHNPMGQINSEDSFFTAGGIYKNAIPDLRHFHISFDISIVYRVGNEGGEPVVYLYGFYTHDELGTGTKRSINKQSANAKKFQTFAFEGARKLRDRLGIKFEMM